PTPPRLRPSSSVRPQAPTARASNAIAQPSVRSAAGVASIDLHPPTGSPPDGKLPGPSRGTPSTQVVSLDAGEGQDEVGAAGPGRRLKSPRQVAAGGTLGELQRGPGGQLVG